jgi:nitroimidazol reductase NimA-like FMN-containing flavoprotein (pyridoxamine 5'-phosphate oxidase superfamily)
MPDRAPTETTNLDGYGNAALLWDRTRELLETDPPSANRTWFLGTTRPDGRPHAAGVGAVWHEGDLYFVSGPGTRKSRNLAENPACTVSASLRGMDVVLEGDAAKVTDPSTLEALATTYRNGGWPAEVAGDAFTAPYSAPSAGPPPWHLYRLNLRTVFGVAGEEPYGATRWRFDQPVGAT